MVVSGLSRSANQSNPNKQEMRLNVSSLTAAGVSPGVVPEQGLSRAAADNVQSLIGHSASVGCHLR